MNKRTHILTGVLAAAAVLLVGAANVKPGFSAWKTQVGVRAALSVQDGRQLTLQEAALTVYSPAEPPASEPPAPQTPAETPAAKAGTEGTEALTQPTEEPTATPEPTPAKPDVSEGDPAEGGPDEEESPAPQAANPAEPMALAAPEESEAPEPTASPTPEPTATPEPDEPEPQAAEPQALPVEVTQPEGLCAEYPEVTLQPGGWAEYRVVLVNEGTADAALQEPEIPDLPEGVTCEGPELPEDGLLRAGERWTFTWILHCEGESRTVAFSAAVRGADLPVTPAPAAAYAVAPADKREEVAP